MFDIRDEGGVRWITIDNPVRRNAIPTSGWVELARILADFEDSGLRAVVITGAGGDFCSGADLTGDLGSGRGTAVNHHQRMVTVGEAAAALHRLSKPSVAAVDGVAVGAGMNLALGCDVTIAGEDARFSEIFVKRGLTVDFGGTWLLPRRVGLARAKELALSGRIVRADEALRYGLVADVVPSGELRCRAGTLAAELAAGAPIAQRFIKEGLDRSLEMTFDEALGYESAAQSICLASEDVVEGVAAFLEKRDPRFEGR
jgi:2-(1,2-epoxy-1,2-dihydrophenyl)acetyl-CoA isomerase